MTAAERLENPQLRAVSAPECLKLLASVPLGRLVYTQGGLPAIRLVTFHLDDDTIVFGTGPGDKFRAAERGDVVAFQADEVDFDLQVGWAVTAVGHLSVVTSDEAPSLRRRLPLHSWLRMSHSYLIRLGIETVHGRRLAVRSQGV